MCSTTPGDWSDGPSRSSRSNPDGRGICTAWAWPNSEPATPEQAVKQLQASIDAGDNSVRNWYGLALAYSPTGSTRQAGRWLEKAEGWTMEKDRKFADRTVHPCLPSRSPTGSRP